MTFATSPSSASMAALPAPVLAVFAEFRTCEFTTYGKDGTPATWPTLPFYDFPTGRFTITTSIGLPDKAFNIRRDGRVALFFSNPTASGLNDPPTVLVQGDAVAPDEVVTTITGFEQQLRQVLERQPASTAYSSNPLTRFLFDWYYMRLVITVTPRRVLWWPYGDTAHTPKYLEVSHVG